MSLRSRALLALALLVLPLPASRPAAAEGDAAERLLGPAGDELAPREFARALIAEVTPNGMQEYLATRPERIRATLPRLGQALLQAPLAGPEGLVEYLAAAARARSRALAATADGWSETELGGLLALQLLDPSRFAAEPAFRPAILALLPHTLDPAVTPTLRDTLLEQLNQLPGFDFAASEAIEVGWNAVPRRSLGREALYSRGAVRLADGAASPIAASIYSLPSAYFTPTEVAIFLTALRQVAPERRLLVLTDPPQQRAIDTTARRLGVDLLPTHGRAYSPWPRDPLLLGERADGAVALLRRPNVQRSRETDATFAQELIQGLPEELDEAWGRPRWASAPVPFHNGQLLLAGGTLWLSLHSLETLVLERLKLTRVPTASFAGAAGIQAYAAAAGAAAQEYGALFGRPIRFVHPLPLARQPAAEQMAMMRRLGGGAGFDLDSWLTLLPSADGQRLTALVADVGAGGRLVAAAPLAELDTLARGYGLEASGAALRRELIAAQESGRAARLGSFLDLAAEGLTAQGLNVRRLPLLLVPAALLPDPELPGAPEFLLSWNNVVVDAGAADGPRAEGFASHLASGDAAARIAFAVAGYELDLLPPLPASILRNGGYRCASNHLRGPIGSAAP